MSFTALRHQVQLVLVVVRLTRGPRIRFFHRKMVLCRLFTHVIVIEGISGGIAAFRFLMEGVLRENLVLIGCVNLWLALIRLHF